MAHPLNVTALESNYEATLPPEDGSFELNREGNSPNIHDKGGGAHACVKVPKEDPNPR